MFNQPNGMPSVMAHDFSRVPKAEIPRSAFNRSHGLKTTFDAGDLVPIFVDEALPGDTFNLTFYGLARLNTPVFPIMDNLRFTTFFFAVPIRLIWENWQRFNGEQDNPADSTDFTIPVMTTPAAGYANGSLADYFGIPTEVVGLENVNALHFRAYNLIYNQWFRDENLIDSAVVDKDDGPDTDTDYVIRKRGKRHDYFTSCLPFPQKGDAVSIPLGSQAPLTGIGINPAQSTGITNQSVNETGGNNRTYAFAMPASNTSSLIFETVAGGSDRDPLMFADLSEAVAATVNQLREAFQIQKLLERDARGGTRYTEIIRAHFGVTSPDARLQRPEYLGGSTSDILINPVVQQSSTDATSPQGNLAAFGQMVTQGHGFVKSFTEHCVLIGLACVTADLTYQQGLNRMWSRQTRFDFYWPALSHIGEQAVLSKEIFADGSNDDQTVFGYQERYAEYRYKPSTITGRFRSNFAQSLDVWHLSQEFSSRPTLNQAFIEENPPIDRVVAVTTEPDIIMDAFFDLKCARPMPAYSVPGMLDHF